MSLLTIFPIKMTHECFYIGKCVFIEWAKADVY